MSVQDERIRSREFTFGFRHSDLIRISSFGFRILQHPVPLLCVLASHPLTFLPTMLPHARSRHRGFFVLFGTRRMISNDNSQQTVHTQCPRCGQEADLVPKHYRTWFTLFFIPVFPMSGATRFVQCSNCGAGFQVSSQQLATRVSENEQEQSQQAIGLYNSLRASPARPYESRPIR